MVITESELVDIIELLDLSDKTVTTETFQCRVEESRIKCPSKLDHEILMVETFTPFLSSDKKHLYFDTENVEYFLVSPNGDMEEITIQ